MKKLSIIFFCLCVTSILAARDFNGIVLDDNVNVRSAPDLQSKSIGKLNTKASIDIYDFSGSGKFENGILDYWACISEDGGQWINANWITVQPFVWCNSSSVLNQQFAHINFFLQTMDYYPGIKTAMQEKHKDSEDDSFKYFRYQNVKIKYSTFFEKIMELSFEDSQFKFLYGIGTGTEKKFITGIFGGEYEFLPQEGNCIEYVLNTVTYNGRGYGDYILRFTFDDSDRLQKIEYKFSY